MIRKNRQEELTGFQEGGPYHPSYDLQTDFVMVYGIQGDFQERIRTWKEKGYVVHLMTGVSWGGYQDYLNGKVDGRTHWDEAQKNRKYENIIHGTSEDIPYMVPTIAYADFLTERIRIAVDAGVEAIHLEEPEFWVEGGYSDAFKREWEIYYREPWQAPHSSVDAQYRASKLKAYLYTRTLDRICSTLKEYAMQKYGRRIRFYVPTHSLINYTQWRIVSPESKLLELPGVDGYIAQVWTGTAQTQMCTTVSARSARLRRPIWNTALCRSLSEAPTAECGSCMTRLPTTRSIRGRTTAAIISARWSRPCCIRM
ncbi:hypothetical protein PghCCS26_60810 [Paenibacillus glycanilyticus]|uniref:Glycosyl hydrolase-like 10 domain-containing protein n=1 Tax=Paenibacillus glycanilyticus TaxID=126569 RepID=A0ABQ6NV33_9BACL|nr:hypothetical protein PghCCS26_60810 [Paenibacillus glycanilyticus]